MATALPLVNVTVRLVDQDGDPVIGAKVSAKLTTVEKYQGYVIPQEYLGQTDDQGTCIVRLFPNELGTEGSEYRFKISYSTTPVSGVKSLQSCHIGGTGCYSSGGKTLTVYASIPNSDCNLEDVCDLDPYPVRGSGQLFTEQVLAAAQEARASATDAENTAAQIKVDIDAAKDSAAEAKQHADEAKSSADIATSKASIATAGADRAQLKADVADSRAKSAESWAEKAKAWAESDTPPDPDDPDSKSAKAWANTITIATPDKPGIVSPQVGDEDGLEQTPDGKLKVPHATKTKRGSVLTSEESQSNTVPQAGADGKLHSSWLNPTVFNTKVVITESNAAWTPPVTGWARVTVIGGGGSGGNGGNGGYGGNGGKAGGQSSFGSITASGGAGGGGGGSNNGAQCAGGGGGGAGHVVTAYVDLASPVKIVIGAGAIQSTGQTDSATGGDGEGEGHGFGGNSDTGGTGAAGAGNGTNCGRSSFSGAGGSGGVNGTGFGGGGGGAGGYRTPFESNAPGGAAYDGGHAGADTRTSDTPVGGNGGAGAVIIEYYDPAKEGA